MPDAFSGTLDSVSSPATRGAAVVPDDVNPLADVPKALFVGTGGSLVARGSGGGGDVTFRNVPAGTVLPFRALFVRDGDERDRYRGAVLMIGVGIAARPRRAFDPGALLGGGSPAIWIDPADLASMFQDAGGAVRAVVNGPVGLIRDRSGRGNHATQTVDAFRPMLRREAGGRHALEFDGVDDFLRHAFGVTGTDATLSGAAHRRRGGHPGSVSGDAREHASAGGHLGPDIRARLG